jgi:hypothetical protein
MIKKLPLGVITLAIAVAGAVPAAAMAHEGHNHSTTAQTTASESTKTRIQGRLDDAKKKVCNTRADAIHKVMQTAATTGQKRTDLFQKIATRVKEFYANKKLNVPNYDQLVAAITTKKQAADDAILAVKDATGFNCDSDNPVGTADQYKADVLAMHEAIKDYRTAIGALLTAVKTSAVAAEGKAQ